MASKRLPLTTKERGLTTRPDPRKGQTTHPSSTGTLPKTTPYSSYLPLISYNSPHSIPPTSCPLTPYTRDGVLIIRGRLGVCNIIAALSDPPFPGRAGPGLIRSAGLCPGAGAGRGSEEGGGKERGNDGGTEARGSRGWWRRRKDGGPEEEGRKGAGVKSRNGKKGNKRIGSPEADSWQSSHGMGASSSNTCLPVACSRVDRSLGMVRCSFV
eukprot:767974-Hanusia_phi.AAC.3